MIADRRRMRPLDCRDCGCRLAVDQRYCIECGARARALPRTVSRALVAIANGWGAATGHAGAGRPASADVTRGGSAASPAATGRAGRWWELPSFELPSPRAVAASVLAVLGFGVLLGSGNLSFASAPLMLVVNESHGVITALVPSTGQAASAPASGGSGSSAAPASTGGGASNATGGGDDTGSSGGTTDMETTTGGGALPPIHHVWVIQLGTAGYAQTFGPRGDPYLKTTLAKQGEVVPEVDAVTQGELANEIAFVSGQGPTPQTQDDCPDYTALRPGRVGNPYDQVLGSGCVFPRATRTLAAQLTTKHDSWKAYVQGLGSVVAIPAAASSGHAGTDVAVPAVRRSAAKTAMRVQKRGFQTDRVRRVGTVNAPTCRHPVLGSADRFASASASDPYVTWRNPFAYFRSVTGSAACGSDVVGLAQLGTDLRSVASTPNVSFIEADPCDDGTATSCRRGAKAGAAPMNAFLKSVVPEIMHSPGYKAGGLILITFAQAPQTGPNADDSSCCDNPMTYPNLPGTSASPASSAGTSTTTDTTTTANPTTTTASTTTTGILSAISSAVGSLPLVGTTSTTATTTSPATSAGTTTTTTTTSGPASGCESDSGTTSATGTATTLTGTGTSTGVTTTGAETTSGETTTSGASTTSTAATTTGMTTTTSTPTQTCTAPGGGQVGLLAISQYVNPGTSDVLDTFNDFSILASVEQLFGLKRLGYAADSAVPVFGPSFYSAYSGS